MLIPLYCCQPHIKCRNANCCHPHDPVHVRLADRDALVVVRRQCIQGSSTVPAGLQTLMRDCRKAGTL